MHSSSIIRSSPFLFFYSTSVIKSFIFPNKKKSFIQRHLITEYMVEYF